MSDTMTTIHRILDSYHQLAAWSDECFSTARQHLTLQIRCHDGCSECCRLTTVCALESVIVVLALQTLGPNRLPPSGADAAICPLLHDVRCLIYENRPLICRTHGLAFLRTGDGKTTIHHCPQNFNSLATDDLTTSPYTIDEDRFSANLARLNLAFCLTLGHKEMAMERFSLHSLVQGTLPLTLKNAVQSLQPLQRF